MMGGIGPEEAGRLTYWQFTALRSTWNARHKRDGDDDEAVEMPDLDHVRASFAELATLGISGTKH